MANDGGQELHMGQELSEGQRLGKDIAHRLKEIVADADIDLARSADGGITNRCIVLDWDGRSEEENANLVELEANEQGISGKDLVRSGAVAQSRDDPVYRLIIDVEAEDLPQDSAQTQDQLSREVFKGLRVVLVPIVAEGSLDDDGLAVQLDINNVADQVVTSTSLYKRTTQLPPDLDLQSGEYGRVYGYSELRPGDSQWVNQTTPGEWINWLTLVRTALRLGESNGDIARRRLEEPSLGILGINRTIISDDELRTNPNLSTNFIRDQAFLIEAARVQLPQLAAQVTTQGGVYSRVVGTV